MAENTTVGPAGSNKSLKSPSDAENHNTSQGAAGSFGSGTNGGGEAGPVPAGHDFSNAGGGPDGPDTSLSSDDKTVGIDG